MTTTKKLPGRPKDISSPEYLMQLFTAYKTAVKKNPIVVTDWVGGMARKVKRPKERPLTMEGFENYCHENNVIAGLKNYFANKDGAYGDFKEACHRIKSYIKQDQIEGGMCGIYNPSITQRLNNLTEKTESVFVEQPFFS